MSDIARIDVGSSFDAAYAAERTPTLRAVLLAAPGKSSVMIELKYYGHNVDLEDRVARIVEETGMTDKIAVMSLKLPMVERCAACASSKKTVLTGTSTMTISIPRDRAGTFDPKLIAKSPFARIRLLEGSKAVRAGAQGDLPSRGKQPVHSISRESLIGLRACRRRRWSATS